MSLIAIYCNNELASYHNANAKCTSIVNISGAPLPIGTPMYLLTFQNNPYTHH